MFSLQPHWAGFLLGSMAVMCDWYLKRQPDVQEQKEGLCCPPTPPPKNKIKKNKTAALSSPLNAQGGASSVEAAAAPFHLKESHLRAGTAW